MEDPIAETLARFSRGLVLVYTGDGKGKTTAAIGQALRTIGHGNKVLVVQFMKGKKYGEVLAAEKYLSDHLMMIQSGLDSFVMKNNPAPLDLVLTGRYAPAEIIALADTVSEIKEIKHHYTQGIKEKAGIEF